jgi:D-alanyl-D-alanine carboxypeptidase/D-alanyl-D-alanine-endopeptidase (penicillin-binding protein 4)
MLDPILRDTVAYSFLKNRKENLYFSARNFDETYFGFGWNWGDYPYSYAAEKSVLPIYGNLIQLKAAPQEKLSVFPALFQDSIQIKSLEKPNLWDALRAPANNQILLTLHPQDTVLVDVPLHTSAYLAARLLQDTLHKPVYLTHAPLSKDAQILYSFPADSLYKAMLQPSDNFLAEHILLMAGNYLPDSLRVRGLNTQRTIDFVRRTYLKSLTHSPQWLDGSGLSRTNLFTPHSLVELLLMIYKEVAKDTQGEKRLFSLLAIGGKAGTLKNLYKKYPSFIFGKTGTLQNNHNLSGYLITKSGKKLCFSFMHNHFLTKTSAIREKMEKILTEFYLKY